MVTTRRICLILLNSTMKVDRSRKLRTSWNMWQPMRTDDLRIELYELYWERRAKLADILDMEEELAKLKDELEEIECRLEDVRSELSYYDQYVFDYEGAYDYQ